MTWKTRLALRTPVNPRVLQAGKKMMTGAMTGTDIIRKKETGTAVNIITGVAKERKTATGMMTEDHQAAETLFLPAIFER